MRVAILVVALLIGTARADTPSSRATVVERLGARLPLDATFLAPRRGVVTLRQLFDGKRPVLLVMAYARCEMLCSLVLRGAADAVRKMEGVPGRDYELVVISLDSRETVDEAARMQSGLLAQIHRDDDPSAWSYLVGSRANIDAVAGALGFEYSWDARTSQFAHPAVLFTITPRGQVARYLHGVSFDPAEVHAALADAEASRFLPSAAVDVLRCFRFDPAERRVGRRAQQFLRIGAASMFALTFFGLVILVTRRRP